MSENIENFINEHQNDLSSAEPSEKLWQKIDSGIKASVNPAAKFTNLKFIIPGVCVVALLAFAYVRINASSPQPVPSKNISTLPDTLNAELLVQQQINEEQGSAPSQQRVQTKIVQVPVISAQPGSDSSRNTAPVMPVTTTVAPTPAYTAPAPVYAKRTWQINDKSTKLDTAFEGIKKIVVSSSSFEVNIHSHPETNLILKAELSNKEKGLVFGKENYKITCMKKDSVLLVSVECTSTAKIVFGSFIHKAVLDFEVPKTTDVVVSNTYGNVSVKDLYGKQCVVKAQSGNIHLENINTGVALDAGYGDVTAKDIKGFLSASLGSGDLHVCYLTGNITIKSSYGDQSYKNIIGNIVSTCNSGDIEIDGMKGDAHIIASYGNVTLDNFTGRPIVEASSGDIKGKQVQLTANTTLTSQYGNIKMDLLNDISSLGFDLKTNYGKVCIDNGNEKRVSEKQLNVSNGTITVKGFTNSGDQHYK